MADVPIAHIRALILGVERLRQRVAASLASRVLLSPPHESSHSVELGPSFVARTRGRTVPYEERDGDSMLGGISEVGSELWVKSEPTPDFGTRSSPMLARQTAAKSLSH